MTNNHMRVAFLHPDLGIGGAERLVVDAALALKRSGHDVTIFTSHHDRKHCFDETRDGTLKVVVLGNAIPRTLGGKFSILCAIARQYLLISEMIQKKYDNYDLFVIDQLSAGIPYIRLAYPTARILFYCHHPDLLLTERVSLIRKLYRLPFDQFERWTTSLSDQIAVNSEYTRHIFDVTFGNGMPEPSVVYPVVETSTLSPHVADAGFKHRGRILLSINRFERKKNIELALEAYALLLHVREDSRNHLLVIAGGYDDRVPENIEHLAELRDLARKFRLPAATIFPGDRMKVDSKTRVLFLPSVSSELKDWLLQEASLLLYTPTNEHFGIVPIEAMWAKTPVLATNTGGPLETVVDGVTGWLREPDSEAWYRVIGHVLLESSDTELQEMGQRGHDRVAAHFTQKQLQEQLTAAAEKSVNTARVDESAVRRNVILVAISIVVSLILIAYLGVKMLQILMIVLPILRASTQW